MNNEPVFDVYQSVDDLFANIFTLAIRKRLDLRAISEQAYQKLYEHYDIMEEKWFFSPKSYRYFLYFGYLSNEMGMCMSELFSISAEQRKETAYQLLELLESDVHGLNLRFESSHTLEDFFAEGEGDIITRIQFGNNTEQEPPVSYDIAIQKRQQDTDSQSFCYSVEVALTLIPGSIWNPEIEREYLWLSSVIYSEQEGKIRNFYEMNWNTAL